MDAARARGAAERRLPPNPDPHPRRAPTDEPLAARRAEAQRRLADAPQGAARGSRARLLGLVHAYPGIPLSELAERAQLGSGTLYYHLDRLIRSGEVTSVTWRRRRLLFPGVEQARDAEAAALSLLRGETRRRIAEAVLQAPGCSIADLIGRCAGSTRVIYYHVKLLVDGGLLLAAAPGRYRDLRPAPGLQDLLARARGEAPPRPLAPPTSCPAHGHRGLAAAPPPPAPPPPAPPRIPFAEPPSFPAPPPDRRVEADARPTFRL